MLLCGGMWVVVCNGVRAAVVALCVVCAVVCGFGCTCVSMSTAGV